MDVDQVQMTKFVDDLFDLNKKDLEIPTRE
jgi:hypothetical protein